MQTKHVQLFLSGQKNIENLVLDPVFSKSLAKVL